MSKDCCHATSASNIYTLLLGREIVRSKEALELSVLLSEQLLAIVKTERYDWPQLNSNHICCSEKHNIYAVEM